MSGLTLVITSTAPVAVVYTVTDERRLVVTESPLEQVVLTGLSDADD